MSYIVIECHGDPKDATIVMNEFGENMVFDTKEGAQAEADECMDGRVVKV